MKALEIVTGIRSLQAKCLLTRCLTLIMGSQGGLVVINRVSHLCDPGSTLASGRMWAEFQSIST